MSGNGPDFGFDSPVGGISQPRSKKKLWIFGGLVCLGLIGLVCLVVGVFFVRPAMAFVNENISFIEASPEVADALGTPVTASQPKTTRDPDNPNGMIFRGTVAGPKGNGTYVIEASMDTGKPVREAIYLELDDGETIDLDPEALFNFEVDDGA